MMEQTDRMVIQWIDQWLMGMGLTMEEATQWDRWIILLGIVVTALCFDFLVRHILLKAVRSIVARTKATWDDILFDNIVLKRLSNIVTPILIFILLPLAFSETDGHPDNLYVVLTRIVEIYIVVACLRFVNTLLKALFRLVEQKPDWQGRPIKGLMQTGQVVVICIAVILIIAILMDKSPTILLTGLGASAAIISLIFKDSILGLVAGVQLSANNMLKVGDWISMPSHGVDGVVVEVALTTVKVRGWDNTIQTLPPYLLTSDKFDNWQAMSESGGRRVKRSLNFDMSSIRFLDDAQLEALQSDQSLAQTMNHVLCRSEEGDALTNVDIYIRYMIRYLHQHPRVNQRMMILVRQLQPTQWGLPVEFYFFSANVSWIPYEGLQAEVISHAIALAPKFGLRIFQYPLEFGK